MNLRFLLLALCALPIMACDGLYGTGDDDEEEEPPYSSSEDCYYDPSSCGETWTSADAGVGPGDATADGGDADGGGAYPPIDISVGTADLTGCAADAGVAYVMSSKSELSLFDPSTFTTSSLGTIDCSYGGRPVAMTASRSGSLYVLYVTGGLYAMDPVTRSCTQVGWSEGSNLGLESGIATQFSGGVESLSLLGGNWDFRGCQNLSRVDLTTATTSFISTVPIAYGSRMEFTSDAYNRLFLLNGDHIANIDPETGNVLGVDAIPSFSNTPELYDLTGMVIGQNLYDFAIHKDDTTVYRYNLATKQTTAQVQLLGDIVAAAAVPCTP